MTAAVTDKLKKFEVGRTIPLGRLNGVVERLNRPAPVGVGGLQQTNLPGGQVALSHPMQSRVLYAELQDNIAPDQGGFEAYLLNHVQKGSTSNTNTGWATTSGYSLEDIQDPGDAVHLDGEQQAMLYVSNCGGSIPIRGIQMHQGECDESTGIGHYQSGTFRVHRDAFTASADHGDGAANQVAGGTITVEAYDFLGLGIQDDQTALIFQTLHDRKWYFQHAPNYCCARFTAVGSATLTSASTTDDGMVLTTSAVFNESKIVKMWKVNTSAAKWVMYHEFGATTNLRFGTPTTGSTTNVAALWTMQANNNWAIAEVALQYTLDAGVGWTDLPRARACVPLGSSVEDDVSSSTVTDAERCASFYMAADDDLPHVDDTTGYRMTWKWSTGGAHASGVTISFDAAKTFLQLRQEYPDVMTRTAAGT